MARITDARVRLKSGKEVTADCFGNNVAIVCPSCKSNPMLLVALPNQKGWDKDHPALCDCGTMVWMQLNSESKTIRVITLLYE